MATADISGWDEAYPHRGHFANYLMDKYGAISIVLRGHGFSVRVPNNMDLDLLRILRMLKARGKVKYGGGHPRAIAGKGTSDILIHLRKLIKEEVERSG